MVLTGAAMGIAAMVIQGGGFCMAANRCGICGRFVNRRYPVCSSYHEELAGDIGGNLI